MPYVSNSLADLIREAAHPLTSTSGDYGPLIDLAAGRDFVLLGEATHGTHEFYRARAEITKRLVRELGFNAVAVEADWPDAYRINRFIRNMSSDEEAFEALDDFKRFPTWMWRNADVLDLIGWLREQNRRLLEDGRSVGWFGLDLYSLFRSIDAVLQYLDRVDPAGARSARARYACFDHFAENSQAYGFAANTKPSEACEKAVLEELMELHQQAARYRSEDPDEFFFAEQNALLVKNAEAYYRTMFDGQIDSWNLRDRHMMETLENLVEHLKQQTGSAKVIVWAHNSHLGDARATQMGDMGEWNLGQLIREKYAAKSLLVGFTTFSGTVTAASDWDKPAERKWVRPALRGSYESIFHDTDIPRFLLDLKSHDQLAGELGTARLQRAIGVVYRPETERASHYYNASLSQQFDAVVHFDESRAVEPLERSANWDRGELPDTYPSAF
ncbi:MAG TPA: erythromycin esterase family protein [Candidatus Saccharimonadales bacterium]|nr:erythromycin esterase family protein [Candidatus Saccharimonadales bacterium]